MNNDNGGFEMLGCVLLVTFGVLLVVELVTALGVKIRIAFEVLTHTAVSFFDMALSWTIIFGYIALAASLIICAVYFTRRYILVVKNGTRLLESYFHMAEGLKEDFATFKKTSIQDIQANHGRVYRRLNYLDEKLEEALKPAEVAPEEIQAREAENKEENQVTEENINIEVNTATNPY